MLTGDFTVVNSISESIIVSQVFPNKWFVRSTLVIPCDTQVLRLFLWLSFAGPNPPLPASLLFPLRHKQFTKGLYSPQWWGNALKICKWDHWDGNSGQAILVQPRKSHLGCKIVKVSSYAFVARWQWQSNGANSIFVHLPCLPSLLNHGRSEIGFMTASDTERKTVDKCLLSESALRCRNGKSRLALILVNFCQMATGKLFSAWQEASSFLILPLHYWWT